MKRLSALLALMSLTACSYLGSSGAEDQAVVATAPQVPAQLANADSQVEAPAAEPRADASAGTKSITPPMPQSTLAIADAATIL